MNAVRLKYSGFQVKVGMLPKLKGESLNVQTVEYDGDLNACIDIAHRVMSSMGWGSREPPEPANVRNSGKPPLNAGSPFQ